MSHVAAAAVPSATRACAPRARNATAAAAGRPPFRAVARARGASGRAPGAVVSFPRAATRLRAAAGDAGAGDAEGASPAPEADAFPRFEGVAGEDLAGAIEALKAADIKSELAWFGANTAGAKALLVERLARCYELKREGKDVQAELRRRTLDRLGEAEAAETEALRRREARRRRAGGYSSAAAAAAAKAGGARKVVKLKRSRGKGIPVTASRERKASTAFAADVDLSEGALGQEPEADKYKLENPLTGRRRLNVVRRDLDRQGAFQETMTEEGWYMVSVPETREERAAELISALSESARVGGVAIDAWTPRAPAADFAVAASEANGLSRVELLKRVPPEEQGSEKPFPGFILLHLSGMNQKLLGALEEVYPFKGFAAGGITRYGNTRKQKSEAPRTVPDAQLEQMMRACEPRVVSDEAFAEMQAEKKAREAAEAAEAETASLEAAMGQLEAASPEEVAAARRDAAGADDAAPASEPSEERAASTAPPGAQTVEVHEGPFKGFKGYVTARRDDGSVDATLTIFGRETAVSLEASEFAFS